MRILALDIGKKHIGLAIGDTESKIAVAKDVWSHYTQERFKQKIRETVAQDNIKKIIVGKPLDEKGKPTQETLFIEQKVKDIEKYTGQKIVFVDERFTTAAYHAEWKSGAQKTKQVRDDAQAARILLQNYLDTYDQSVS